MRDKGLSLQNKFYSIFEIINIFQALQFEAIQYAFRSIWGNVNRTELQQLLSILVAGEYVKRSGLENNFFCINRAAKSFLEFEGIDITIITMEIIDLYEQNFLETSEVVRGIVQ